MIYLYFMDKQNEIFKVKDWITLDLVNTSSTTEQTVNLFELPSISGFTGQSSWSGQWKIPAADLIVAATSWTIEDEDANVTTLFVGTLPSPAATAATTLQAALDANTDATWTVQLILGDYFFTKTESTPIHYVNVTRQGTVLVRPVSSINSFPVNISIQNGNYTAITESLNFGGYKIESANVYADNVAQANRNFRVNNRSVTGFSHDKYNAPSVSPVQRQFVNENIELNYNVTPTNQLQYDLGVGESLRLIIKYVHSDSYKEHDGAPYNSELINEQISESSPEDITPIIEDVIPETGNPMLILVNGSQTEKPSNLDNLKKFIEKEQLDEFDVDNLSDSNIKKQLALIISKESGTKGFDPYNYLDE